MKNEKRLELGKKLQNLINKSTGQNEATPADGGYTVNTDIVAEILSPNFTEGSLYAGAKMFNVGDGSNGLKIPVAAESVRAATGILGGVRAYVVKEGVAKTPSFGKFAQLDLKLNKAACVIYITDELKQDAEGLVSYVSSAAQQALLALIDESIIYDGSGLVSGINGAVCTGLVTTSDPITAAQVKQIFDKYYGGKNGTWYLSKIVWNQILDLYEYQHKDATADLHNSVPVTFFEGGGATLYGYPVVVLDVMKDNSILLADMTQYVIVQKEIRSAVNTSIKWLEDESCFRFVIRMNGDALWRTPITLTDTSVVHPFVMSAAEEASSSSSSSSESSSSESSASSDSVSLSSASESSASSHSNSSESSSSSVSSASSSSNSSDSSSTDESLSSQSESSSMSGEGTCKEQYTASGFATAALNGVWDMYGIVAAKPAYKRGVNYLFWDTTYSVYAISGTAGDPPNQWLSSQDVGDTCPNGTYVGEAGTIA